ncbi:unnamed protein product [Ostreobium quekettii]|uniref:Uncharacterized protein n=1 Tax=Ostreobium quekettii TaxID=121088 RepID=A0A8S1JD37_9CHLO|nr:unnamed protein product [Ostreobium quekettii]CAD7703806.1 unnamed protein product [Ostreobium quekettii]|eukprot:evm.model.scf_2465.1 EVM.evm.TU.scf_2465.1   scf_2465:9061-12589(+)
MAAAAVARVAIAGSASKPLLEDPEERKKMTLGEKFKAWFCANPLANLPILLLFSAGVVCIVGAAVGWHVVVAVLGFAALSFGGYQIWALRNLKAEVDRFSKENAKLEETEQSLKQQVSFLETQKEKLGTQVDKLEGTVVDLKEAGDNLASELEGFEKLKENWEKWAGETGKDVSKVLENANKIYEKMHANTVNNEKALLGKIAQDLEFADKDVGLSETEFNKWLDRIPKKQRDKYKASGFTYESIAGADGTIDFMEIENLITKLMEENTEKLKEIKVTK